MYFYLEKQNLLEGNVVVIMQVQTAIMNYKEIKNFGKLVEYEGDAIPNEWEFDGEYFYGLENKPSPFHKWNGAEWIVADEEKFKKYCDGVIDEIKAEKLKYGFDYAVDGSLHRQKCRDKDIAFMVANVVALQVAQSLGKVKTTVWYFEDDYGKEMNLEALGVLMLYGTTFVQSVFNAENYFKKLENPKVVTSEEFEAKRQEIHQNLVEQEG